MSQMWIKTLVMLGLVAGAGWHFREPLRVRLDALMKQPTVSALAVPSTAESALGGKETVYRWVDENGVTHFDQRPQQGSEAVVIDQSRIRAMDSPAVAPTSDSGSPVVSLPSPEAGEDH